MNIEISVGEGIDKLNILELKKKKINDLDKKIEIEKEIKSLNEYFIYKKKFKLYYNLLLYVNEKIWDMTNIIKTISVEDIKFAHISNEIFNFNQKRFRIKSWFNIISKSNIKEQKSYDLSSCFILINNIDTFYDKIVEIIYLSIEHDTITIISNFNDKIKNIINIPTINYQYEYHNNDDNKLINLDTFLIDLKIKHILKLLIKYSKFSILYGIDDNSIDVTSIAINKLSQNGIIIIPSNDYSRNNIFGDPIFGTHKYIYVTDCYGNEYKFSEVQEVKITINGVMCNSINKHCLLNKNVNTNYIKIINLQNRTDRKKYIQNQFKKNNISNYEFVNAIDGKSLTENKELFLLFERNDFNFRKGVIGCALSHIFVWNELINDKENEYYVILEDDVKICDNFGYYLNEVCKLFVEQKMEHLALGEYNSNKKFPNDNTKLETYKKDVYKEWNAAFAYIISKQAAIKAIAYMNNCSIKCAIDNTQAFGNILNHSGLNVKLVNCEIINEHGSDIQTDINDYFNFTSFENYKQILTISFCDWWEYEYCGGTFDFNDNFFTNLLKKYGNNYDIKIVSQNDNPDILFYSIFGNSHKNYSAKRKIFYSGEPYGIRNDADYNLTFDENSLNNVRLPLWVCYFDNFILDESNRRRDKTNIIPQRSKFCSFIATGPGLTNNRKEFVDKLSQYKQVDCGGSYLNNIGYNVPLGINCSGKINHNNQYKFGLAFESKNYPGYVTEKICDLFKSNVIPIYWGTNDVIKDFNPNSFINANDFSNFDELVEFIRKVDNDDELYNSFFKHPILSNMWIDIFTDKNNTFFKNIADNIIGHNNKLFDNFYQDTKNIDKNILEILSDSCNETNDVINNVDNVDNVDNELWILYAYPDHNYKVIEDYINSLQQKFNIVYTQDIDYVLSSASKKISYIMYINDDRIINKFKNTDVEISFLNTEPLSISHNLDLLKSYINKYPFLKIYDYNFSNLQIILQNNMYAELLEYNSYQEENNILKSLLLNEPKTYDFGIVTYGNTETNTIDNLFHKKKDVTVNLIEKGFKVHIISGWGIERDKELAKCKVILNVHSILGLNNAIYYSKTFENIRCIRLLDAGFKILSEDSIHCNDLIHKYKNLKFLNYNSFKNIEYSDNFWEKIDNNTIKKYCFIHSCNIEGVGTYRLEYLINKLNDSGCKNIFEKIYINNIGLPIENIYGEKFEIINYSDNIKLFENPTINLIKQFSEETPNSYILYLHTKGVRYDINDNKENDWINYMLYFLVEKFKICVSVLDNDYDTVGCNYSDDLDKEVFYNTCPPPHYSGNFWWANTNYLRTLQYLSMEIISRNEPEFWLFKNRPNFYNLHSSNLNHYLDEYPRQLYAE